MSRKTSAVERGRELQKSLLDEASKVYESTKTPADIAKAAKGGRGRKNQIGRGYHHGKQDVEERAVERTVRQTARREIAERTEE